MRTSVWLLLVSFSAVSQGTFKKFKHKDKGHKFGGNHGDYHHQHQQHDHFPLFHGGGDHHQHGFHDLGGDHHHHSFHDLHGDHHHHGFYDLFNDHHHHSHHDIPLIHHDDFHGDVHGHGDIFSNFHHLPSFGSDFSSDFYGGAFHGHYFK